MLRWIHRDRPTGEANPFEVYLLAACIFVGLVVMFGKVKPESVTALLPVWMRFLWALLLVGGGVVALLGLYWPGDPFSGVEIKRVGLAAAAFGTLAWGTAAAFYGWRGVPTAVSNILFSLACATRFIQVGRRIRLAREHLQAVRAAVADDDLPASGVEGSSDGNAC